jgi:hypothetical protein
LHLFRLGHVLVIAHLRSLLADRDPLESEDPLADGVQGLHFLAQDFPGFFVADLSLGKPLDHIPDLGAVLVGPLIEGVRRTGRGSIKLHGDMRIFIIVNIADTLNTNIKDFLLFVPVLANDVVWDS